MIFIKNPEPMHSATASAMPTPAANTNEADTEGRSNLRCLSTTNSRSPDVELVSTLSELFSFSPTKACSSATKDVVILSKGTLNNLDTRLNTEIETPTAASSTDPKWPTNALSTNKAIGSAASANTAGNAIDKISSPSSSTFNSFLKR